MFTFPPPQYKWSSKQPTFYYQKRIIHQNKSQHSGELGPDHKCQLSFFDQNIWEDLKSSTARFLNALSILEIFNSATQGNLNTNTVKCILLNEPTHT